MSRLSHIAVILPLTNITSTLNFFVDKLGFRIHFQTEDPLDYAVLKRDSITFSLSVVDNPPALLPNNSAYIFCEDIDSLFKEYQAKGVSFREPLGTTNYGMREFVLELPSGHRLAFGQGISGQG